MKLTVRSFRVTSKYNIAEKKEKEIYIICVDLSISSHLNEVKLLMKNAIKSIIVDLFCTNRSSLFFWILIGLVCTLLLFYRAEERISKSSTDQNLDSTINLVDNNQSTGNESQSIYFLFNIWIHFALEKNK